MPRSDTRGLFYASPPAADDGETDEASTPTETQPSDAVSTSVGPSPADD